VLDGGADDIPERIACGRDNSVRYGPRHWQLAISGAGLPNTLLCYTLLRCGRFLFSVLYADVFIFLRTLPSFFSCPYSLCRCYFTTSPPSSSSPATIFSCALVLPFTIHARAGFAVPRGRTGYVPKGAVA